MRLLLAMLFLVACSSTAAVDHYVGDAAGDAGCPPGPTQLTGAVGSPTGVPADPQTGGCPSDYCFVCTVLDWPVSCPNQLCVKGPDSPAVQYPGQCISLCDAGAAGDAGDAGDAGGGADAGDAGGD